MSVLQSSRIWKVALVVLMVLSSLPRFGCLCDDGVHLPYCQKLMGNVVEQVMQLFRSPAEQEMCVCCGGCEHDAPDPDPCSDDPSAPCECQVTVEGPLQSSPPRDSFHPEFDVLCSISFEQQLGFPANGSQAVLYFFDQIAHEFPALAGTVRLNI